MEPMSHRLVRLAVPHPGAATERSVVINGFVDGVPLQCVPVVPRLSERVAMSRSRAVQLLLVVACAVGLAACGFDHSGQQAESSSSGAPVASDASASLTGPHYQASISLVAQPEVGADGKDIVVTVRVTNTGNGAFGSANTPHPVNIGAHSIDAAGKVLNIDLSRGKLPQVAPGSSATAAIEMPVDSLLGRRAEILPVEEGVAWFNQWPTNPTQPLIVGPFMTCGNPAAGKVCDTTGKPLPVAASGN